MQKFENFAKRHNITVEGSPIETRSDRSDDWDKSANHWQIQLYMTDDRGKRLLWSGQYSKGSGHAEAWAKKNKTKAWRYAGWEELPFGKRYRDDSKIMQKLRELYGKQNTPNAAEILLSLQLDTMGCDQPFEHWAPELGYSDDSIKARHIWETCNDIRRQMQATMTRDQWEEFGELEE